MKKFLLLLVFVGGGVLNAMAQADSQPKSLADYFRSRSKTAVVRDSISNVEFATKFSMDNPGTYLIRSGHCQAAALTFATASAALSITGGLIDDKVDEHGRIKSRQDDRKACFISAGVCGGIALISEICSIHFKIKAGRSLQLMTSGNTVGVKVDF